VGDSPNGAGVPDQPPGKRKLSLILLDPGHLAFWALLSSIATVVTFGIWLITDVTSGNPHQPSGLGSSVTVTTTPSPALSPAASASPSASPSMPVRPPSLASPPPPSPSPSGGPAFAVLYPTHNQPIPMCIVAHGRGPEPPFGYHYWVTHQATEAGVPKGPHFGATITLWKDDGTWTTSTPFKIGEPGDNGVILVVWVWRVQDTLGDHWRQEFARKANYTVQDPAAEGAELATKDPLFVERVSSSPGTC